MAFSNNPSNHLAGFSGKFSGMVIKQYKDKTVIASRPRKSKKKPSAKKKAVNEMWSMAVFYARHVIKNPERKLATAIALKIQLGEVYSTLIADYMENKGDEKTMLKIPTGA